MDERTLQWRVGIVVICAALILAILIFLFGEGWQSQYTLFINTRTAPNVTKNTPVRKNGILIGRVFAVDNQDQGVLLTLKINSDEPIFANEICQIGTASFLGDAVLDFTSGDAPSRGDPVEDRTLFSNVIVERSPVDLIDMALDLEQQVTETLRSVTEAGDRVAEAGEGVTKLTGTLQQTMGAQEGDLTSFITDARNLSQKMTVAIDNFNTLMVNVNDIAGDPQSRDSIKLTINRLPDILEEIDRTVVDARETINGFQGVSDRAANNLQNLESFTQALGDQGPDFVENLNRSLMNVDELVTQITSFTESVTNSEGTLGKFLNDPELYNNLNETIRNVRDLSVRLRPLMNDVRYAVDGIARDPGQLGIRGALDRSPAFGRFKGSSTNISNRNQ